MQPKSVIPEPEGQDIAAAVEWNIRFWVWRRDLTLKQTAKAAGVSLSSLHRVLGRESDPTTRWLQKLAAALDVDVADLVAWDGEVFRLGLPKEAWPRRYKRLAPRRPPEPDPGLPRRKRFKKRPLGPPPTATED